MGRGQSNAPPRPTQARGGSGAETAYEVSYGRNRKHGYGGGTESGPRSRGNQNRNHNSTPALAVAAGRTARQQIGVDAERAPRG